MFIENMDTITYIIVGILVIFTISFVVKKIFKLALVFALIAIMAYYLVPDLFTAILLP